MTRTYVVTGSASGIGRATCERLEGQGHRVIDVDLRDASVTADLSRPEGRAAMVEAVTRASGGTLDAVVANAGTMSGAEPCVRVNYFGAVATLDGLRGLLAGSDAPRAVVTASCSILNVDDNEIVEACLAGDEEAAVAVAAGQDLVAYPSSKRAVARWVRRHALSPEWAGAGIALNAVAPGVIDTPMATPLFEDAELKALMDAAVPMPFGGVGRAQDVAAVIAFLAAADTIRVTGQVLFADAGADVTMRGENIW